MTFERDLDFDRHMMDVALAMARRGLGTTWPNPSVGAVVVDEHTHEIVSRGWTAPGGRPHGEPVALARAGERARGKSMFVTLEPCSHVGRTPPCVDGILASGITRVVVGHGDPDPRVAGRGIARLREAGVRVDVGVCHGEAHEVALGHILRVTERRPFVQLKLALGRDGQVVRGDGGKPSWVTGPVARAHGHMMRALSDAILIGSGTLRDDNPELTCRLPGLFGRSPVRVVVSSGKSELGAGCKIFSRADEVPVWIARGIANDQNARAVAFNDVPGPGVEAMPVTTVGGQVWLPALAEALVERGITRLLVEGGPTMWRAFSRAGLVDEVVAFVGGGSVCGDEIGEVEAVGLLADHLPGVGLTLCDVRDVGDDRMFRFLREMKT